MTGKTRYDLDRSAHAVYSLHYHIIFVIKYRRKALHSEKIRERLKEIFRDLAPKLKIEIVSMEPAEDHIHMLIKGTPSTDLVKVVNSLKGVSSRYTFERVPGDQTPPVGRFVLVGFKIHSEHRAGLAGCADEICGEPE